MFPYSFVYWSFFFIILVYDYQNIEKNKNNVKEIKVGHFDNVKKKLISLNKHVFDLNFIDQKLY